jgi:YVTN family beta-propeller protein
MGRAFVANIGSGSVTAIDLETGKKLADIATGDGAEGIATTPDGGEIWVGNRGADSLSVIDPETLEIRATLACPGFPIRVAISPDGKHALVSAARSGEVVLFDVAQRKELRRSQLDLSNAPDATQRLFGDRFGKSPVPVGLVISPSGDRAWVAATQADAVVVLEPRSLKILDVLTAGREPDGMAYSTLTTADR